MSTPNGSVYQVVLSGQVFNRLKELHRQANSKGHGPGVLSAVRRIFALLRTIPLEFGEARFTLSHLNLEVRVGTVPPLGRPDAPTISCPTKGRSCYTRPHCFLVPANEETTGHPATV
jgi:hypothetical protein